MTKRIPVAAFLAALILVFSVHSALAANSSSMADTLEITGEASVAIADDFEESSAETHYFIVEKDKKTGKIKKQTRLYFKGPAPQSFKTGKKVKVKGKKRSEGVEVEEISPLEESTTEPNGSAEAPLAAPVDKRILTILVDFSDRTVTQGNYGTDVTEVRDRIFNEPRNVKHMLYNASLGTMNVLEDVDGDLSQDVFGPYAINMDYLTDLPENAYCNATGIVNAASTAWEAANPGKNILDWQHRLFILPNYWDTGDEGLFRNCTWGGYAQLGCGTWCWALTSDPDSRMHGVIVHELGHNFGFNHARTDENNNGYDSDEPTDSEYGDDSDMMGGSRNWKKFNAPHVEDQDWVDSSDYEIRDVLPSPAMQHFDLIAMDEEAWEWPGLRAIKIARDAGSQYFFSWRQKTGDYNEVETEYTDGVNVHYGFTGNTYSYFVQTLAPGETFTDVSANLTVTIMPTVTISEGGDTTTVIGMEVCTLDCGTFPYPTQLAANATTPDSIRLTWNDRAFTEDGYEIERSPDGSAWLLHDTVGTDIDSYLDTGLSENTTWYYRVRAFEGGTTSDWSNVDSATTPSIDSNVDKQVATADDDVEEYASYGGYMLVDSSTFNIGLDTYNDPPLQAGLRFSDLTIPQGAVIDSAFVRFVAITSDSGATTSSIHVEDAGDAPAFTTNSYDLTNRSFSSNSIDWNLGSWSGGGTYDTPSLTSLVQQTVNKSDWYPGNAMVFKFQRTAGDGAHRAITYDYDANYAARLMINYTWSPAVNVPPTASFTTSISDLDVDFTDTSIDSDGNIVSWSWDFGDGNNSTVRNPSHSFTVSGTYTVQLTVTDNESGSDTTSQSVTVTGPECVQQMQLFAGEVKVFSLPCNPGPNVTVTQLLSNPAFDEAGYGTTWMVYSSDNMNQAIVQMAADDVMGPGVAYFMMAPVDTTVTISGEFNTAIDMPLADDEAGAWNFVGYQGSDVMDSAQLVPMNDTVPEDWAWADKYRANINAHVCDLTPGDRFQDDCRIRRILQIWRGNAFVPFEPEGPVPTILEPFETVWVQAFQPNVKLHFPQVATSSAETVAAAPAESSSGAVSTAKVKKDKKNREWYVRLTAQSGRYKDRGNLLGQLKDSQDGQDSHDLEEMSPIAYPYLSITFDNDAFDTVPWGYSTDFRAVTRTPQGEWRFTVKASPNIGEVTLRWQGDSALLDNAVLVDEQSGNTISTSSDGSFTFSMAGNGESHFRFIVQ